MARLSRPSAALSALQEEQADTQQGIARTLAGLVPVSLLPGRLAAWQNNSNHGAGSDLHQRRDEEGGTPPAPLVSTSLSATGVHACTIARTHVRLKTCVFSIVSLGEQPPSNRDNCAVVGDSARDLSAENDAHRGLAGIAGPRARPKSFILWSGQWCGWRCALSMSPRIRSDDPLSRCSNFMRAPMLTVCGPAGGGLSRAAGCGRARAPRTPCGSSPTCPTASRLQRVRRSARVLPTQSPANCRAQLTAMVPHRQDSFMVHQQTCASTLGLVGWRRRRFTLRMRRGMR